MERWRELQTTGRQERTAVNKERLPPKRWVGGRLEFR
jgi:hypothetical protein